MHFTRPNFIKSLILLAPTILNFGVIAGTSLLLDFQPANTLWFWLLVVPILCVVPLTISYKRGILSIKNVWIGTTIFYAVIASLIYQHTEFLIEISLIYVINLVTVTLVTPWIHIMILGEKERWIRKAGRRL